MKGQVKRRVKTTAELMQELERSAPGGFSVEYGDGGWIIWAVQKPSGFYGRIHDDCTLDSALEQAIAKLGGAAASEKTAGGTEHGYNALGALIIRELDGRPPMQLARDAGIQPSALTQIMKQPLAQQFPSRKILQAIADGLDRSLPRIQAAAIEASLAEVDPEWQHAIVAMVMRWAEEINRHGQ